MKNHVFEIQRKDSEGNYRKCFARNAEDAYRIYNIAGSLDANPIIVYQNKQITYLKLIDLLKHERNLAEKIKVKMILAEETKREEEEERQQKKQKKQMKKNKQPQRRRLFKK